MKKDIFIIFAAFSICLGFLILFLSSSKPLVHTDTALGIAESFNTVRAELVRDGKLYANIALNEKEGARNKLRDPEMAAVYSWSILGHASLYQLTKEMQYVDKVRKDFEKWKSQADGLTELYGLFQIYRAYHILEDHEVLSSNLMTWYWGRVYTQIFQYKRQKALGLLSVGEPILLATLAQQFMNAYTLLENEGSRALLFEHQQFQNEKEIEELQSQLEKYTKDLTTILSKRLRQDVLAKPYMLQKQQVPQHVCWEAWTRYGLYENMGIQIEREKARQIIDSLQLSKRTHEDLYLSTLQSILPCAEVMAKLGNEYKRELKTTLERIVFVGFDRRSLPLCSGTDGFLTKIPGSHDLEDSCQGNGVFLSDSAWMSHIMTYFPEEERFVIPIGV